MINYCLKEKFEGCLVGGAVGDALGAPLEFLTREEIKANYGRVTDYVKALPKHPFYNFNPGQYTDDTQLTVILAESILDQRIYRSKDFASKLSEFYKKGEFRSLGPTCREACRKLSKGKSTEESGVYRAEGVGAAMRAAPLGLYSGCKDHGSQSSLMSDCEISTRITHDDYKAAAGTLAVAASVVYLKNCDDLNVDDYLKSIENYVGHFELVRRNKEECDEEFNKDGVANRLSKLIALKNISYERGIKQIGNSGYVLEAVPAAIYAFIKSPEDFEKTVLNAVNNGGDADSIASIAGALSGAYNGINAIPKRFIDKLENYEYIKSLADKLFEIGINKRL